MITEAEKAARKYATGQEAREKDVIFKKGRFYVVSSIGDDYALFGNLPGSRLREDNDHIGYPPEFEFVQRGRKARDWGGQ